MIGSQSSAFWDMKGALERLLGLAEPYCAHLLTLIHILLLLLAKGHDPLGILNNFHLYFEIIGKVNCLIISAFELGFAQKPTTKKNKQKKKDRKSGKKAKLGWALFSEPWLCTYTSVVAFNRNLHWTWFVAFYFKIEKMEGWSWSVINYF